jgi:hypothetical protein
MRLQKQMAGLVLGAAACGVHAQTLHDTDYLLRVSSERLETGSVGPGGQAVYPVRVKTGVLGSEGIPNFTNDPGVDAQPGVLVPGMFVGFDIVGALRAWDPVQGFATISPDRMTVRKSGINTQSPTSDQTVPGIIFGQADLDAAARFHHHVAFILNPAQPGTPSGVWLFIWELWTDAPGVERTEPLYIVFAQGAGVAEMDEAVAWVEDNLLSEPCVPDLNNDGTLNFFDVSAFIGLFNAQDPRADLAAPFGVWNFFDVSAFIGAYNAGCP